MSADFFLPFLLWPFWVYLMHFSGRYRLYLTLPINILSLVLFTFVLNAVFLMIVSGLIPGFDVYGFWSGLFGSLLISLISWIITSFIYDRGTVEYIALKKSGGTGGDNKNEFRQQIFCAERQLKIEELPR